MSCQRFKADSLLFLLFVGSLWHLAFLSFCGNQRKAFNVLIIFRCHCLISLDASFVKISVVSGLKLHVIFAVCPAIALMRTGRLDCSSKRCLGNFWEKLLRSVHNFAKMCNSTGLRFSHIWYPQALTRFWISNDGERSYVHLIHLTAARVNSNVGRNKSFHGFIAWLPNNN